MYELEGCKKAVNFLTKHYRVRSMRIILNGRKVGNGDIAVYYQNKAYFTKRGLTKRTILHELYHHIMEAKGLSEKMSSGEEERQATAYSCNFIRKARQ